MDLVVVVFCCLFFLGRSLGVCRFKEVLLLLLLFVCFFWGVLVFVFAFVVVNITLWYSDLSALHTNPDRHTYMYIQRQYWCRIHCH